MDNEPKKSNLIADGWHTVKPKRYFDEDDGEWHTTAEYDYFVDDGSIMRGVMDGKTVYPYVKCKGEGYDNVSGIAATRYNLSKIYWF